MLSSSILTRRRFLSIFTTEPDAHRGRDTDGGGRAPEDGVGPIPAGAGVGGMPCLQSRPWPARDGCSCSSSCWQLRRHLGRDEGAAQVMAHLTVVAHVVLRAGAAGQVPAPALSDGFEGGETDFMSAFKEEVDAEARRRGLTRPRLSGRRIGWLCLLLFVPAGTVPGAVAALHQRHGLAWAAGLYLAGCVLAVGVGVSRRRSAAGQTALERWRSAVAAAPGDARLVGYAAALGAAPAALAVFA